MAYRRNERLLTLGNCLTGVAARSIGNASAFLGLPLVLLMEESRAVHPTQAAMEHMHADHACGHWQAAARSKLGSYKA
eukprot:6193025-Pleurochrysis_carterae.AAC.2